MRAFQRRRPSAGAPTEVGAQAGLPAPRMSFMTFRERIAHRNRPQKAMACPTGLPEGREGLVRWQSVR